MTNFYNIFLYLISRLYPLCLFNEIFLNSNIINLMSFFFISLYFTRYNFKKQVVLALENKINSMNNRYRKYYNLEFFEGFKLRLGGRLTRRQRASSF